MNKHFYLRDKELITNNPLLTQSSKDLFFLEKAEQTISAYESDWNDFFDWCQYVNESPFPAKPETIVNYINNLSSYAKANTIARRISALSENFIAAGLFNDNPCASPLVKGAMKSIRRKIGTYQRGKTPLLKEDLVQIITTFKKNDLIDLRDKTILIIGFMGAFRRSELANIQYDDLKFSRNGVEIFLPYSKTDQEGHGEVVALPYLHKSYMCPVTILTAWLEKSSIKSGPIFRGFTRAKKLRSAPISDQMINKIVKERVRLIGLDPTDFGAHSLRHGFATSAALSGIEERDIMKQTRHHSVEMVRHYINEADRFQNNPIEKMFNK